MLSRSSDLLLRSSEEIAIKFFKMNSIVPRDGPQIADWLGQNGRSHFNLKNLIGGSFQVRENPDSRNGWLCIGRPEEQANRARALVRSLFSRWKDTIRASLSTSSRHRCKQISPAIEVQSDRIDQREPRAADRRTLRCDDSHQRADS